MAGENDARHSERLLYNVAAEAAVLGAIIFDNQALDRCRDILKASDFYAPNNQRIYDAAVGIISKGQIANGITLHAFFDGLGQLADIGGIAALTDLIDRAAFGPEIKDYAEIIKDLSLRRRMVEAADKLKADALTDAPASELLMAAQNNLTDLQPKRPGGGWVDARVEAVNAVRAVYEGKSGPKLRVSSQTLTRRLGGLFGGEIVIIGGASSMGKTAFSNWLANDIAVTNEGAVVAVVNLEMQNKQAAQRFASLQMCLHTEDELPYERFRQSDFQLPDSFFGKFSEIMQQVPAIYWQSVPRADFGAIHAEIRRLIKLKGRLDCLVVDYLQLMQFPSARNGTRASDIGDVTSQFKELAMRLDIPVILLSQLSRSVAHRDNNRPMLSDLRDSGSIEQDADTVLFCHRENYYLERQDRPTDVKAAEEYDYRLEDTRPKVDLICAKARQGQVGTDTLYWNAGHGVFFDTRSEAVGYRKQEEMAL